MFNILGILLIKKYTYLFKVLSRPDRLLAHTSGIFNIEVSKVGEEIIGPSTAGPGRPSKPFSEKGVRGKRMEAASIAEGQDPKALFQVPTYTYLYQTAHSKL